MSTTPNISTRPLTASDLEGRDLFGKSVRGVVAERDGEILGMMGVLYGTPLQAFSEIDDGLREYPKLILKTAKQFRHLVERCRADVYAVANENERNSDRLLKHVGFEYYRTDSDGKRVYRWQTQARG